MNKIFFLDTETDSKDARKAKLTGIGLGVGNTIEFLIGHYDKIVPLISDPDNVMVGHGLLYDITVLQCNGFEVKCQLWDTMGASWLIDENCSHELKDLVKEEFGIDSPKFKDIKPEQLEEYGKNDAKYTKMLYEKYKPIMDSDYPIFYNLYMPLLKVVNKMQNNGVEIDLPYLDYTYWQVKDSLDDLEPKIREEIKKYTKEEINLNSPDQLAKLFFNTIGLKVVKETKGGKSKIKKPSTDAEVLRILASKGSNIASLLVRYKEKYKLMSTYIKPIQEKVEGTRLHTEYNPFGTLTGRFNSKNPNLENIPVKDKGLIRSAFIAAPGKALIISDYSQIELRILAHCSKDKQLVYAFNNNLDIHKKTASGIFGIPYDQVTKEMREEAKTINYGLVYGMSKFRLSNEAHMPLWKASKALDSYFKFYAGLTQWKKDTIEQCHKTKFVETILKRKRRLPDIGSNQKAERQSINSISQGSTGDIINTASVNIDKEFEDTDLKILLQTHDELMFECDEENADSYIPKIADIMENSIRLDVPIKVKITKCKNWSEK